MKLGGWLETTGVRCDVERIEHRLCRCRDQMLEVTSISELRAPGWYKRRTDGCADDLDLAFSPPDVESFLLTVTNVRVINAYIQVSYEAPTHKSRIEPVRISRSARPAATVSVSCISLNVAAATVEACGGQTFLLKQ